MLRLTWSQVFLMRGALVSVHHQSDAIKIIMTPNQPSHFSRQDWGLDMETANGLIQRWF